MLMGVGRGGRRVPWMVVGCRCGMLFGGGAIRLAPPSLLFFIAVVAVVVVVVVRDL